MNAGEQTPQDSTETLFIGTRNYRAFRSADGFRQLKLINLIIGKNNVGKSTLIDIVEFLVCPPKDVESHARTVTYADWVTRNPVEILQAVETPKVFHTQSANGRNPEGWLKKTEVRWVIKANKPHGWRKSFAEDQPSMPLLERLNKAHDEETFDSDSILSSLLGQTTTPFEDKTVFRLLSDRDISPAETRRDKKLKSNGDGLIQIFERFQNDASADHFMLRRILDDLNFIYGLEEGKFQSIEVKQTQDHWDVFLLEPSKGFVPLSESGSGLKTLLLVLAFLRMLPALTSTKYNDCIFCFEELENNLHPSIQRRLFQFLRDFCLKEACTLFITSHSNTAIDIFSRCKEAQILHVTHDSKTAKVQTLATKDLGFILDDLGFKASDILQSNFVIWVEGPSDRIYLKHGLKMIAPDLEEGIHYSTLIYGGRLLSYYDYDNSWIDSDVAEDLINLSKINRNSAIMLDSDKKLSEADEINETKRRIIENFLAAGCLAWLTWGREIENYVAQATFESVVRSVHGETGTIKYGQFDSMVVLDDTAKPKKYIDKVKVAKKVCEHGNLVWQGDWNDRIKELAAAIRKANGISEPPKQ